jgi:hypothetical protein
MVHHEAQNANPAADVGEYRTRPTKSYETKPSGRATKIPKPKQMEIFTAGSQDPVF